jgi:[ribosomal protein S5]-alanine N-acetyltransferase
MTKAVEQIVDHAFENFPVIERIFARPFGSNIASQRILDKAGFLLEAKFKGTILKNGKVEDELVYAIRR